MFGVALVATGGHGRGELAPQSDLDLLLLHDGSIDLGTAQRLWYPMWDAKLKVGHSVRTVAETLALASDDLPTATSLLSVRRLAGDASLATDLAVDSVAQWRKQSKRCPGVAHGDRDLPARDDRRGRGPCSSPTLV